MLASQALEQILNSFVEQLIPRKRGRAFHILWKCQLAQKLLDRSVRLFVSYCLCPSVPNGDRSLLNDAGRQG
jgi:hypothetical protein